MSYLPIIAGVWLSLLYAAAVMPATVWIIQLTVSRGWKVGSATGAALALGQIPWCLAASLLLFQFPAMWQSVDPYLRILSVLFLFWMTTRTVRAGPVAQVRQETSQTVPQLAWVGFQRSLMMPWRLPFWASLIVSIGIHLRGPGVEAALLFTGGAWLGQCLWAIHFAVVAGLFGHRVPEEISLRSMNKLRLLSALVLVGLALIILAPMAFPPI